MQVFVEITSSLGRRLKVIVPTHEVEIAVQARLQQLAGKIKMDGFRPGKAPMRVIEQRFAAPARSEAIEKLLETSLQKALIEEKLYPAETPTVQSIKAEPGQPLEYTVAFEACPDIQLHSLSGISLEKLVAPIAETDVDAAVEQIRKLHALWNEVQRPAELGDKLTVDIQGIIAGQPAEHLQDKNASLILDEATLPPGFIELVGAKVGDSITIKLPKPETAAEDQSKVVSEAVVKIHAIAAPELPIIDAEFAHKLGIPEGDVNVLRDEVRKQMEQQLAQGIRNQLKEQVIDALLERHPLELPKTMVDEETKRLEQDLRERIAQEMHQTNKNIQLPAGELATLQKIARKRTALGLLFPAVIRAHNIKVGQAQLQNYLARLASTFDQADDTIKKLINNKEFLGRIQSQLLEEEVIDRLLKQVNFIEKNVSYTEALALLKSAQQGHDHDPSLCNDPSHHHHHQPSADPIR